MSAIKDQKHFKMFVMVTFVFIVHMIYHIGLNVDTQTHLAASAAREISFRNTYSVSYVYGGGAGF